MAINNYSRVLDAQDLELNQNALPLDSQINGRKGNQTGAKSKFSQGNVRSKLKQVKFKEDRIGSETAKISKVKDEQYEPSAEESSMA
mmetsp:Transcript_11281/g.18990  ORF Transcript_11281/g.18990 Transcript_11281/m.18990 type:complete len:87 (-) Transcript_11281:59-319(-)